MPDLASLNLGRDEKLSVAIVGGGMGGIAAAVAMGKAGLKVDLFEQAMEFIEIGAGINLGPNTIDTIRKLGLGEEYDSVAETDKAGGLFFQWWDGKTDTKYGETFTKYPRSAVHRARLLEAMHSALPSSVTIHFGSRINHVENLPSGKARLSYTSTKAPSSSLPPTDSGATLINTSIKTEETFEADVIVGADGIKSVIRTILEVPSSAAAGSEEGKPAKERYTGTYCYRGLIPMEAAKKVDEELGLGEENTVTKPRMWFGGGKHILIFPIEKASICNIVAFVTDHDTPKADRKWPAGPWVKKVPMETILADFEGWDEHPRALLKAIPECDQSQWALHEVLTPTKWRKGRITLLGDSAHASLPHNGAGAGQAIEDAYVLTGLLAHPQCNHSNVEEFLQAYEDVRIPRTGRQQLDACETGEMFDFVRPGFGDDMTKIAEEMKTRHDWIWDFQIEDNLKEAVELLKSRGVISK